MMLHQPSREYYDAAVIGGGFFGCCLALAMRGRYRRILIVEREDDILKRASLVNQARVHNGYHYPRSLVTALRSAVNYPRFRQDLDECVDHSFLQVYAVARGGSRVTAYQYRKFCENVGIPLRAVPGKVAALFRPALIEEAFAVDECAFDASKLRELMRSSLQQAGVEVAFGMEIAKIGESAGGLLHLDAGRGIQVTAGAVFNCAYSQINHLLRRSKLPVLPLKHEVAEMAMIEVPPELEHLGITVMDGPFFSTMPFPPLGLHSLSHVSYTPHESWSDLEQDRQPPRDPHRRSRSLFMLKDAQRYVPAMSDARYVTSLFETKTVLLHNEVDDGRPILYRPHHGLKNHSVILGAKIDNIYDVLKALDAEVCFPRFNYEFRG